MLVLIFTAPLAAHAQTVTLPFETIKQTIKAHVVEVTQ